MNTVYKYDLPAIGSTEDTVPVVMPAGARPLTVQLQYGEPKLWALVNPANDPVEYTLRVAGTGHPLERISGHAYLGTVQLGGGRLVFHYFSTAQAIAAHRRMAGLEAALQAARPYVEGSIDYPEHSRDDVLALIDEALGHAP